MYEIKEVMNTIALPYEKTYSHKSSIELQNVETYRCWREETINLCDAACYIKNENAAGIFYSYIKAVGVGKMKRRLVRLHTFATGIITNSP